MKKLIAVLAVILLAFGVYVTVNPSSFGAVQVGQPAAPAQAVQPAVQPGQSASEPAVQEPVAVRTVDYAAIRALRPADEVIASLGSESASWGAFCDVLQATGMQVQDYFTQMAAYFGMAADWEGSVGDGTNRTYAQYTVGEAAEEIGSILGYRAFAAEQGVVLSDEDQAQLTPEALAVGLLGDGATVEQMYATLEAEGMSVETYRWIRETSMLLNRSYTERYGENGSLVTEEEAAAWMTAQGYVSAGHILFMTIDPNTGDPLDAATVAAKLAQAEAIVAELRAIEDPAERMERFAALKEEFCEDGGKTAYPDGYTYTPGTMAPAFEDAVNALGEYEISDPVESSYGYHVIVRLPLKADALLYSAMGTPSPAREQVAVTGMNELLEAFLAANPAEFAEGIETFDLVEFLRDAE